MRHFSVKVAQQFAEADTRRMATRATIEAVRYTTLWLKHCLIGGALNLLTKPSVQYVVLVL